MQGMDYENLKEPGAPYAQLFGETQLPSISRFVTDTGRSLATYSWSSTNQGVIILVHGFAEHLGRYYHVADFFVNEGFDVHGVDHMAHGLSDGFAGAYGKLDMDELVTSWSQYILAKVCPLAGAHYIYCHSTGGLITLLALETLASKWDKLQGVIFSAPLIRQPSPIAQPMYCCPTLSTCCLSCGLACGTCCLIPGIKPAQLSGYKAFLAAAEKDSLYFGWKANFSVIRALLQGTVQAQKQLQRPSYPFLVMVSPNDELVDPTAAKALFEQAASTTKAFEIDAFRFAQHELHNEEDWQKPLKIALQWLHSLSDDKTGIRN